MTRTRFARAAAARRGGIALMTAVLAAFMAAAIVSLTVTGAISNDRLTDARVSSYQATYLAEGGAEVAKRVVLTSIADFEDPPSSGTVAIDGVPVDFTINATGFDQVVTDDVGIQTIVTGYEIEAEATVRGVLATHHMIVNARATPTFQFAVFYDNDLEIFPGPSMELAGRVHSNADLYIGCGGTLTCNTNYLRAVGGIYRDRKDTPGKSTGTVKVREWVSNPFDAAMAEGYGVLYSASQMLDEFDLTTESGLDSRFAGYDADDDGGFYEKDDWLPWGPLALEMFQEPAAGFCGGTGYSVLDKSHGVSEAVTPSLGTVSSFVEDDEAASYAYDKDLGAFVEDKLAGTHSKGYYHSEADLSLLSFPDGSWAAYDNGGVDITEDVKSAVVTDTIFDARQANGSGETTDVLRLDLSKLAATGHFPDNGLIFSSNEFAGEGTDAGGLILTGGEELHAPLTVVSPTPVYIHGDYNTVDKKGAAVITDALNLLSNAWDGSKAGGSGLPTATETTYNLALITGNHSTAVGTYNGGLENLPRFHESWSGVKCHITGSFVNLWESQHATGKWKYGSDRYKAPGRMWGYDPAFNQVKNLPPYTPMAVTAENVVTW